METTEDCLLGKRVLIIQPRKGYRVAVDPVLLAAAVPARAGDRVLDLGAGTGAASFCLKAREPDCFITGIEPNDDHLSLSLQSAEQNGWLSGMDLLKGSVEAPPEGLEEGAFDWVMANPP
ncbi:MAG TPA: methyltransferase, partial [Alphaproteobacteria bacterium]|nr:methyltransferase [Alphaproteobacteria bacterium]